MHRLRAAAGPVVFVIGMTLICASMIQLQRWPAVVLRILRADFEEHAKPPWALTEWAREMLPRSADSATRVLAVVLINAGLLGLIGFAIAVAGRRQAGGVLVVAGALLGWLMIAFTGLSDIRLMCPPQPLVTESFSALVALLAVGFLLLQASRPLTLLSLAAPICVVGMIGVTVYDAGTIMTVNEAACVKHSQVVVSMPDPPSHALGFLCACGCALALARPFVVSRALAVVVFMAGLFLGVPALAIAHDAQVDAGHEPVISSFPTDITLPSSKRCPPALRAPLIEISATDVILGQTMMGSAADASSLERTIHQTLIEVRKRDALTGDLDGTQRIVNLQADRAAPVQALEAALRASLRSGYAELRILTIPPNWPIAVWTMPLVHKHVCALPIEVSDDGRLLSDFADFSALVSAADSARAPLRLRVEGPPEERE